MKKEGKIMIFVIIVLLVVTALFMFNQKPKYHLYHNNIRFKNVKDTYRAGQKVKLYYNLIATDTDYRFSVEGAEYELSYSDSKGYILEFIMPENDVTIHLEKNNSMVAVDYINEKLFYFYRKEIVPEDGSFYEVTIQNENGHLYAYEYTEKSAYIFDVEEALIDELNDYIQKHNDFKDWQDAEECIDGAYYKFAYYQNGEEFKIDSDQMILEGQTIFEEINTIIQRHIIKPA